MPADLDRSTGLITEGTHLFKVTRAEEKLTNDGIEQWVLDLTCQDPGEDQGKKYTEFFRLSGPARWKFDNFLDAVDAPKKGTWTVDKVMNSVLRVTIVHREFEGRVSVNAQQYHLKSSTANPEIKRSDGKKSSAPELLNKKSPF